MVSGVVRSVGGLKRRNTRNHKVLWQEKIMSGKKSRTGLSNVQNVRLGGLIAVLSGRDPYDFILDRLLDDGFVERQGNRLEITDKGMREKDRLVTLAGLMFEKNNIHQI